MNATQKRPGLLFTLVGPAGAGKNRLIQYVVNHTPLRQLPTATTRPIRSGEQDGREHVFVTEAEFKRMLAAGELLEHEVIHGNLYGMPRAAVEKALDSGKPIIADIGMQGDTRARAAYPENVISVFIQPPSIGSLIQRMRDRRESETEIGKRLLRVPSELAYAPRCSYAIMNDRFEEAAAHLCDIVNAELRGEHSARGDALHDYHYRYAARIIPIYQDQALRCTMQPDEPQSVFGDGELPHEVALRALQRELQIDVKEDALIAGDKPNGRYVPPVNLMYLRDAASEDFIYVYLYRLDSHFPAPEGWSWVELAEQYNALLLERRSEA